MKTKKLLLPAILVALTLVAYIAATLIFCYTTKPAVSEGEIPFSITYEHKGEKNTLSGIYKCKFYGSDTIWWEHSRYWDGEVEYDNPLNVELPYIVEQNDELQTTLAVFENVYPGYFMGDPLYKDYYQEYADGKPWPYIEYCDYKNEIYSTDENKEEILESIGFKIIECSYPEPIENSFSLSGIRYKADNIIIFNVILLIFFLLCLIFVRKDKEYKYSAFDKVGIVFNFLVGIFAIPFISIICTMFGITGSGYELIDQIIYNIPPLAIMCLALSVVFRRKGFSKTGFFVQFGGILLFVLPLVMDTFI